MMKLNIQKFAGYCSIYASETNVDIANNTSQVGLTIALSTTGSTYNTSANSAYYQVSIKRHDTSAEIYNSGKQYL